MIHYAYGKQAGIVNDRTANFRFAFSNQFTNSVGDACLRLPFILRTAFTINGQSGDGSCICSWLKNNTHSRKGQFAVSWTK